MAIAFMTTAILAVISFLIIFIGSYKNYFSQKKQKFGIVFKKLLRRAACRSFSENTIHYCSSTLSALYISITS